MKKFTIEEKTILLISLDHYIGSLEVTRSILHDTGNENGNALAPALNKFRNLRVKLILDNTPIEIRSNNLGFRHPCILCGANERPDIPEWGFCGEGYSPICGNCFKKYEPELYEKMKESNKQYYIKEYPDDFNPDGTLKNVVPVNSDDLPFFE